MTLKDPTSDLYQAVALHAKRIPLANARSSMPTLIRAASRGEVFEIFNAKNEDAPTALLLSPDVLRQRISPRVRRTLAQLVESLPFKRHGSPRLSAELPDDEAPLIRLPKTTGKAAA